MIVTEIDKVALQCEN